MKGREGLRANKFQGDNLHTLTEHKPCKAAACVSTQGEHGVVGTLETPSYRIVQETVCGGDFHLFARKGRYAFIIIFHVIQALKTNSKQ